jgi:hypothetical protein
MLTRTFNFTLSVLALPIGTLIALMDWNNGRTFRENLREIMATEVQDKDNDL